MNTAEMILPDIPRLYTALAEWLACLLCILEVRRRLSGMKLAGISLAALVCQIAFLELTKSLQNIWWVLCMGTAVLLMYGYISSCTELGERDGYYCIRAFVEAEFVASIEWQTYCWFSFHASLQGKVFCIFWLFAVYGIVYAVLWFVYKKYASDDRAYMVTNKELAAYIIIGLAVFLMSNLGFVSANTIFGGQQSEEIFNVRTLVDLGGVAIMYAYHVQRSELLVKWVLPKQEE